ncbi:MAG TPA: DUF1059 domain-containing protein [Actinomycetota bacterium]|nr:DUF1059 domain-containing protein [Actinomycetota bacterium]
MLEVRCADLGLACRGKLKGRTRDELLAKVRSHAAKAHGVPRLNATLESYAASRATGTEDRRSEEG